MLNWLAADTPRAPQEPAQQQMQTRARSTDASLDATMAEITHRLELERQLRSRSAEPTMEAAMAPKFLFRSAETGRLATVAIILTTFPVPFKARARAAYIAASQGHRAIVELLTAGGSAQPAGGGVASLPLDKHAGETVAHIVASRNDVDMLR